MGGPAFTIVLAILCTIGVHEYLAMASAVGTKTLRSGLGTVPLFAIAAWAGAQERALLGAAALAVGGPLVTVVFRDNLNGTFVDWALSSAGSLYLGIPLFAAIATRRMEGTIEARWLDHLASWASFGWDAAPRGLAWLLVVILVTWLSDTGAYLVGRSFGRRPLRPAVSPKKTVEGLLGGLAFAGLTGALAVSLFGLGVDWALGALIGLLIGAIGVVGDLTESLLKRQAGVKDSGTLIPGHGGVLDRLDALLFTLTAGWFIASLVDHTV